jgi:isoquinoline 1-oxidoreductase subunit beta
MHVEFLRVEPPARSIAAPSSVLRINETPAIEVHIVKNSEPPGRMGEAGTSAIVPAVTNAICAATGTRLRKLPIDTSTLKQPA